MASFLASLVSFFYFFEFAPGVTTKDSRTSYKRTSLEYFYGAKGRDGNGVFLLLHGVWGLEYSVMLQCCSLKSVTFSCIFLFLRLPDSNIEHATGIKTETARQGESVRNSNARLQLEWTICRFHGSCQE